MVPKAIRKCTAHCHHWNFQLLFSSGSDDDDALGLVLCCRFPGTDVVEEAFWSGGPNVFEGLGNFINAKSSIVVTWSNLALSLPDFFDALLPPLLSTII
jgi:hypothetical protein